MDLNVLICSSLFFSHYIDILFTHGRDTDTIKFEKGNGREQCQIIFQFVL